MKKELTMTELVEEFSGHLKAMNLDKILLMYVPEKSRKAIKKSLYYKKRAAKLCLVKLLQRLVTEVEFPTLY